MFSDSLFSFFSNWLTFLRLLDWWPATPLIGMCTWTGSLSSYQPFKRFVFKHIHYKNIDLILLSISCNYIMLFSVFQFSKIVCCFQDLKLVDYKSFHWNLHKKIAHKPFNDSSWIASITDIFILKNRGCSVIPICAVVFAWRGVPPPAFPQLLAFLTRAAL